MSKEERQDRYLQFPLCLLQKTYSQNQYALNLICGFGIVNYAKSFEHELSEVARQLMYKWYRNKAMIQYDLLTTTEEYVDSGEISIDEDYSGFSGLDPRSFDPKDSINDILRLFGSDQKFKEEAILCYQCDQASAFLLIEIGDITNTIKRYIDGLKIKQEFERQFGGDAMPMVKPSMLFEFRDSGKDIDLFRAYVAIRSIIGRNTFATANKPAILSRMVGCKSKAAFEYYTTNKAGKDKSILPTVEKYSKKYQMDKLLLTLVERKMIMFLSKPRISVMYVSTYMEPEELGQLIKDAKAKKNLKQRMKDVSASL